MSVTSCYCIDIDAKKVEILEFSGQELQDDYKLYNTTDFRDLVDHDRHLFEEMKGAKEFLVKYNLLKAALETLPSFQKSLKNIPKLLLKRRYLVTSLMEIKNFTTRSYKKSWIPGQRIQLYDQTYYVTVILTKIEDVTFNGIVMYKYDYELCK